MNMRRNMDERMARAAWLLEAHKARRKALVASAMAARDRSAGAAELRMAQAIRAQQRAMEAIERRLAEALRAHELGIDPFELIRAIKGRRKPPGFRRDLEGGEDVPAVPKPKPNPLAGAAAAPIE